MIQRAEGSEAPVDLVFTDPSELPPIGSTIALIRGGVPLKVLSAEPYGVGFKITVPARPLLRALRQMGA